MPQSASGIRFNKRIFQLAAEKPGITRSEIAKALNISLSKAGYDISTLMKYGLLSEYPGKDTGKGRHPSGFRVRCPVLFRIYDLSARTFNCTDYTADGMVVRTVNYPYYAPYPFDTNLELYSDRVRQGDRSTAPLMCALLLPPPARFVDPTAPIRPAFPTTEIMKKNLEIIVGHRIFCTADRVSAISKGAGVLLTGQQAFFGLHLGDEVFSVYLSPGKEPVVRSLKNCLSSDSGADCARIARMSAGVMYLGGVTSWQIYAERKFYAVKEQIEQFFPSNAEFPREVMWNTSVPHHWLLQYLRSRWLDQVCTNFNRKIAGKG